MPRASHRIETISAAEACEYLIGHHHLRRQQPKRGTAGIRALFKQLRVIQLDPLDVLGTNPDLVALARVDGVKRGEVFSALMPGHAWEHYAKERCLLPHSAFPYYRTAAAGPNWWKNGEREKRVPPAVIERVYDEVAARGPLPASTITDHGAVDPLDWQGWKGTRRATVMALEILFLRCRLVITGRNAGTRDKVYDTPERAFGKTAAATPTHAFERWALLERVEACGLLARGGGVLWSMLRRAKETRLADQLIGEGLLTEVRIDGHARSYLAPAGFLNRKIDRAKDDDGRMRIIGPLDPLLWDRRLVKDAFGFDYIWEVYKPAAQRRWGWYVVPLLHGGRLVGRFEGRVDIGKGVLRVDRIWREAGVTIDERALDAALERHAEACGAASVKRPKRLLKPA